MTLDPAPIPISPARDPRARGALLLVALTPLLFGLATFWLAFGTRTASLVREFALPVYLVEMAVVIAAIFVVGLPGRDGLRARAGWLAALALLLALAWRAAAMPLNPDLRLVSRAKVLLEALDLAFFAAVLGLLRAPGSLAREAFQRALLWGMAGFAMLVALYCALHFGQPGFDWRYFGLGGVNIRNLSFYLSWSAPIAAGLAVMARSRRGRVGWAALLVGLLTLALWSGTRSIPVAGAAALVAMALTGHRRLAGRTALAYAAALGLSAALASAIPSPNAHFGVARIEASTTSADRDVSAGRGAVWAKAIREIREAPFAGHGDAGYAFPMSNVVIRHPHDFALQWAHAWGIPAALLALSLLGAALWRAFQGARREGGAAVATWGGLCALLSVAAIDGALFHPYPTMMVAVLLALALAGPGRVPQRGDGAPA